eukprot:gene5555-biopygen5619
MEHTADRAVEGIGNTENTQRYKPCLRGKRLYITATPGVFDGTDAAGSQSIAHTPSAGSSFPPVTPWILAHDEAPRPAHSEAAMASMSPGKGWVASTDHRPSDAAAGAQRRRACHV